MDATLYRADGTQENIQPENGTDFKLQQLYPLLGCRMVEVVSTGDPSMILITDEEAKCKDDYIINREATRIYREGNGIPNTLEGARAYYREVMARMGGNVIYITCEDDEPFTIAGDVIYCPSVMLK